MPGSETGSSTTAQDQYLDGPITLENKVVQSPQMVSVERTSIERTSSRDASDKDVEKAGVDHISGQPPSGPPAFNPADFPDGGLEAVSDLFVFFKKKLGFPFHLNP